MMELGVFGITVSCPPTEPALKCSCSGLLFGVSVQGHPELNPGSVPRTKNLDAQRRNEEPVFFFAEDGGPLTDNVVFISAQRVFALKRTAALMLAACN